MQVIDSVPRLSKTLQDERAAGHSVGLVPTMGALHAGHRSLIERAVQECGAVAVTIFVNPLQFGDAVDFAAYPRALDADIAVAEAAGARVVFAPSESEMYPDRACAARTWAAVSVRAGSLGGVLEGISRPGHFDGVATVVAKLFAMAGRCRAYFGEKDFQQLQVVHHLVADLSFPVEVVGCPTVREADGLALSSRNARLSPEERRAASVLNRALHAGAATVARGARRPAEVASAMRAELATEPLVRTDYAVVVDPDRLDAPSELAGALRLLVAAYCGTVRLIDNMEVLH